eukprot:423237-Pyramimonas_sp.AAC.1
MNIQIDNPRDGETDEAVALSDLLALTGSSVCHCDGPTRVDADSESQIDMVACPFRQLGAYGVRKAWEPSVSDHAILYLEPQGAPRTRRDNTIRA